MAPVILIVEDEILLRLSIEDAFMDTGFELELVGAGSQAIAKLQAGADRFACLVTDVRLGAGPSGWAVGHKAREFNPTIPVIYMTADSEAAWAANGVPNSLLLRKPFAMTQLIVAVSQAINAAPLPMRLIE